MGTPTFPTLWADVLTQLNTFLSWDIVKGFLVISVAIMLGALTMVMFNKATH